MLHGYIQLPAYLFGCCRATFELAHRQTCRLCYDVPGLDYTYHTCHSYTAYAYQTCIVGEHRFRSHRHKFSGAVCAHEWDYDPPHECRAGEYHERILQTHDIAQSEQSGTGIATNHQLGLFGKRSTPRGQCRGYILGPYTESCHDIIIDTPYEGSYHKCLCLTAVAFAFRLTAHQHLSGGGSFRERIFAMHILHEILAERYEEQDSQHTAEQ